MADFPTKKEVLRLVRGRLGGVNAGKRLASLTGTTDVAGFKWLRDEIPRDRVRIVSAVTGLEPWVIRPDKFVPPAAAAKNDASSDSHRPSVPRPEAG